MKIEEAKKLREFWILEDDNYFLEVLRCEPSLSERAAYRTFHVIEYSAYDQLQKEIEDLRRQIKNYEMSLIIQKHRFNNTKAPL